MKSIKDIQLIIRPRKVMAEVKRIVHLIFPDFDFSRILAVYQDVIQLFAGDYVGYRKCNTRYHDLRHTEDCILEFARIVHGASLNGRKYSRASLSLGLISALLHDTGYIQKVGDNKGTGAKYTSTHVERSIDFAKKYLAKNGYSSADYDFCKNCLKCTGLHVDIKKINFISADNEMMGYTLGVADLIGQMSDYNYLEKLPILFKEYQEGKIPGYETEIDLMKKTPEFWRYSQERFRTELGNVDRYLKDHFRVRWGIDRDLDREAIEFNITRLNYILKNFPTDYRNYLRRQNLPEQFSIPLSLDDDHTVSLGNQITGS